MHTQINIYSQKLVLIVFIQFFLASQNKCRHLDCHLLCMSVMLHGLDWDSDLKILTL